MKKINLKSVFLQFILLSLVLISVFSLYSGLGGHSAAVGIDTKDEACRAINSTAGGGIGCQATTASSDAQDKVDDIIESATNVLSFLVGGVSVIMLIFGGFKYVTSNGDASQTKNAKDTIMYALIGLIIVLFAQVIVRFVWTNV